MPTTRTEVSYNFTRTFSVNIANRAGRINVATDGNQVCSYYQFNGKDFGPRPWQSNPSGDPTGHLWCQDIELWVEWSAVKHPTIHLTGADSYAKEDFIGSKASADSNILGADKRGSYSQYGLLTGDNGKIGIKDFGSAGYTTADDKYRSLACKLSYANTDNAQGNCNDLKWLQPAGLSKKNLSKPSLTNAKPLPGGSNVDLSNLPSGNYNYTGSVPLNISGNLDKKGKHITIFAEQADVTITDNIDADASPYTDLSEIPSFTIMAKTIKVKPEVTRITGTYVATDHFESCNGAKNNTADLGMRPDSKCQHKLKVNGAIVSDKSPIFRRTFGAGDEADDDQWNPAKISSAAEWINYTPNLWLVPAASRVDNRLDGLSTTQVTSLPVRY